MAKRKWDSVDWGWNTSRWGMRERTDDHRNDPIANVRREASVSVEEVTPEKVLGSTLPERRDSCEKTPCVRKGKATPARGYHELY